MGANRYVIRGNTFKYRQLFKQHKLLWNATSRCWEGHDFDSIKIIKAVLKKYDEPLYIKSLKQVTLPQPENKKYKTRVYTSRRKIAALKGLNSAGFDANICTKIASLAFPRINLCKCTSNWTCNICHYACCEKAYGAFCVCLQSTVCPDHGKRCNGSHD